MGTKINLPEGYTLRPAPSGAVLVYGIRPVASRLRTSLDIERAVYVHQLGERLLGWSVGFSRWDRLSPKKKWRLLSNYLRLDRQLGNLSASQAYRMKRRVLGSALRRARDARQLELAT